MIDLLRPVDSSNMRAAGHDERGQVAQFHVRGCARTVKPAKGDQQAACNCPGGPVYHYPGVPAELHQRMMAAPSVASFHHAHIKSAKHPTTGAALYPAVKLDA